MIKYFYSTNNMWFNFIKNFIKIMLFLMYIECCCFESEFVFIGKRIILCDKIKYFCIIDEI